MDKVINKLIENKFIRKNRFNNIYSITNNSVILLDHFWIIQFYNMKWYDIKNFYFFIVNRHKLGDIHWWLLFSLVKTLAKKYK